MNAGLFITVLVLALAPRIATAQEARSRAVEFTAGTLMFADDGIVTEGMWGAAARYYVSPRVAIGPEVLFVQGNNHRHFITTGNVTVDFVTQAAAARPTIIPFAVMGGGVFHTRDRAPQGGFASNEGAFTAGGGVRAFVNERVLVGAEARIGWELHLRFNGLAAWTF